MSKSTNNPNSKLRTASTKTTTKKAGKSLIPDKYQDLAYCLILVVAVFFFFSSAIFGEGFNASDNLASESFKTFLNEAKKEGRFPLWIPYIFSGMPAYGSLLLTGDRFWDFIPKIVFGVTIFIGDLFNNDAARVVSFYAIYAIGMYLLIKQKGMERVSAFFGAFAATFSTSVIVWAMIGHNTKPIVLSFLPFIFLFADKLKKKFSLLNSVLLAIVVHLMLSGAHLQMIFYSACAVGIYFAVEIISTLIKKEDIMSAIRPIGILIVCGGLAFALSADRFLATREYTPYSTRGSAPIQEQATKTKTDATGGNTYEYSTMWSFAPSEMMQFAVPSYNGFGKTNFDPTAHEGLQFIPQMVRGEEKLNLYWGQKPIEDAPPYMGVIVLLVGIASLILNRKNPFAWFLAAVSFFALLLSFGNYMPVLYDLFYYHFPSFNKFRAPSMVLALMQFAMPLLAAMGLNKIITAKPEDAKENEFGGKLILGLTGFYFVAGLINYLIGKQGYFAAIDNSRLAAQMPAEYRQMGVVKEMQTYLWGQYSSEWIMLGVLALVAGIAIFMMQRGKLNKSIGMAVVILLTMFDLFRVGWMPMEVAKTKLTEAQFSRKDYYDFIKEDKNDLFRIADFSASPNVAAFYKLQSVNGYHSAKLRVYQDLLDVAAGGSTNDVRNPFLWNLLNVKYIVTPEQMQGVPPVFQSQQGQVFVYRNTDYMPRLFFVNRVEVAKPLDILNKFKYNPQGQGFSPYEVAFIEKPLSVQIDSNFTENRIVKSKVEDELMEYNVSAGGNNFLFISEIYYPAGWKAYLDGKEIEIIKTNYAFRGVVIPKGQHKLKFEFKDPAFEQGKTISTATSMLLGILLILSLVMEFKRKKANKKEDVATETEEVV